MRTLLLLGVAVAAGVVAALLAGARAELRLQLERFEREHGDPAVAPHGDADADSVENEPGA